MTLRYHLILFIVFTCKFYLPVHGQVNIQDSLALIDLYDSTNGDTWYNNTNWKTTEPLFTWPGVSISNNRVVTLYFVNNNLSGHLPNSIGNLTELKSLTLLDNKISGGLPSSIGSLVLLEGIMNISGNPFGGSIPESFGNLKKLKRIAMYGCELTGNIPSSFKNLDSLEVLELDYNNLSGNFSESIPIYAALSISVNHFTFDGIEQWARQQPDPLWFFYGFQANIPIKQLGDRLAVSAGGTLANDTFSWHKSSGELIVKKVGDSTFRPTVTGSYYVEVTNSIAKDLILKSDIATAATITLEACSNSEVYVRTDIFGNNYQWQVSTDSINYIDITDAAVYAGINSSLLLIKSASSSMYGNRYRCKVDGKLSIFSTLVFSNTWKGDNNSSWSNIGNWSCGNLPDENTDVIINSGAVINVDSDVAVRSLQLSPGAQVIISSGHKLIVKH